MDILSTAASGPIPSIQSLFSPGPVTADLNAISALEATMRIRKKSNVEDYSA
jgi:hypothetical protein